MTARDDIAAHFTTDLVSGPLLDAYRAEVLREAADIAESAVTLFEDSDEAAAAAGALEGLAIRFRRLAAEAEKGGTR